MICAYRAAFFLVGHWPVTGAQLQLGDPASSTPCNSNCTQCDCCSRCCRATYTNHHNPQPTTHHNIINIWCCCSHSHTRRRPPRASRRHRPEYVHATTLGIDGIDSCTLLISRLLSLSLSAVQSIDMFSMSEPSACGSPQMYVHDPQRICNSFSISRSYVYVGRDVFITSIPLHPQGTNQKTTNMIHSRCLPNRSLPREHDC